MQFPAALSLALFLTACALPGQAPLPATDALPDQIARECRLLERAHAAMEARGENPQPDILVGCPDHAGLRDAMSMPGMSAATRRANAAPLPAGVQGARADMVYRRMITRGVSLAVAAEMAATPEFAAAVR
ncbi:hypothetical protein [Pararhodobacter sp.]|uniref:hypothetical protein n=1 Tax=Pararhodobacter sp. TaxID=2127056 RepID=UPI002FDDBE3D